MAQSDAVRRRHDSFMHTKVPRRIWRRSGTLLMFIVYISFLYTISCMHTVASTSLPQQQQPNTGSSSTNTIGRPSNGRGEGAAQIDGIIHKEARSRKEKKLYSLNKHGTRILSNETSPIIDSELRNTSTTSTNHRSSSGRSKQEQRSSQPQHVKDDNTRNAVKGGSTISLRTEESFSSRVVHHNGGTSLRKATRVVQEQQHVLVAKKLATDQKKEVDVSNVTNVNSKVAGTKDSRGMKKKGTPSQTDKPHRSTTTITTSTITTATAIAGGRESAVLRRIKHEWRDAVKLGIAYDWIRAETMIQSKKQKEDPSNGSSSMPKNSYVRIGPFGKNLLRWHFSVQGPPNSVYESGVYHGRVLLPKDYPGSPPRIQLMTPSGRFLPGEDICLSASNFHPESWTPRWTVISLVDALRLHMLTTANEIGGKDSSNEDRRRYAALSRTWQVGRSVDHGRMISAGLFPSTLGDTPLPKGKEGGTVPVARQTSTNTAVTADAPAPRSSVSQKTDKETRRPSLEDGNRSAKQQIKTVMGQTTEAAPLGRKKPIQGTTVMRAVLRGVVQILTNPVRLAVVAFLAAVIHLNS